MSPLISNFSSPASACRNGKTIPETVPLSREKQEYTARVPGGNG